MTRGPTMAETRWSNYTGTLADTNDVETMSTAPPISSYRAVYRHAPPPVGSNNQGTLGVSPDHHIITPTSATMPPSSTVFEPTDPYGYSISDWSPRHGAIDVARVQLKPNSSNAVTSSDSDIFKRSVNERLDKYMVIRQRTFHGLVRSKSDLRQLPLTDPRETMSEGSTPTWLHRSKTDLYIEKWRSKSNWKNRERSKSGSSAIDLSGMTLGSLCDNLPKSRLQQALSLPSSTSRRGEKMVAKPLGPTTVSNGWETRFPPLHSTPIKNTIAESNGKTSTRRERVIETDIDQTSSATQRKSSSSDVHVLPSPRESVNNNRNEERRQIGGGGGGGGGGDRGELPTQAPIRGGNQPQSSPDSPRRSKEMWIKQKKPVAAIPLQVWEPSFERVPPSNQKTVSPRHRAWHGGPLRQGVLK